MVSAPSVRCVTTTLPAPPLCSSPVGLGNTALRLTDPVWPSACLQPADKSGHPAARGLLRGNRLWSPRSHAPPWPRDRPAAPWWAHPHGTTRPARPHRTDRRVLIFSYSYQRTFVCRCKVRHIPPDKEQAPNRTVKNDIRSVAKKEMGTQTDLPLPARLPTEGNKMRHPKGSTYRLCRNETNTKQCIIYEFTVWNTSCKKKDITSLPHKT